MTHHIYCHAHPDILKHISELGWGLYDLGGFECNCNNDNSNNEIYKKFIDVNYIFWDRTKWQSMFKQGRTKE